MEYKSRISLEAAFSKSSLPSGRMLTRDFIHNSLYHPVYGYFSKNAKVFSPRKPYDFNSIKNNSEFMDWIARDYVEHEHDKQVWHTPTELFQPHYGNAIAAHIVKTWRDAMPSYPLRIYEFGAGNGTLANNIMDYVKIQGLSEQTRYNIIEISGQLAAKQKHNLRHKNVVIHNKSILEWDVKINEPCFIIGLEVLVILINKDNLSHDLIRYDTVTNQCVQGMVQIDPSGDFEEIYEPITDPHLLEYLNFVKRIEYQSTVPNFNIWNLFKKLNPIHSNLTDPEFVPTNAFLLLKHLKEMFPLHRLILSDFDRLPDSILGLNAPVVQSRYQKRMIPCSTYMVQPGLFDIFFPTDFQLLAGIYEELNGKKGKVLTHKQFLQQNAIISKTNTISGENPMLEYYENASFFIS